MTDGLIRVAGVFNVRTKGNGSQFNLHSYWRNCGKIDPQYGIMFVEAMLFAIDKINNDNTTLHGLKMSALIHNTCGNKLLLRNALARIADWQSQGVIGPLYSDDAKTAATVMNIFGKNTVSYSASSPDLENRERYRYLYRTVPSDRNSVRMLLSIALKFNWRYIAMISSHGNYDASSDLFRQAAKSQKICIPVDVIIPEHSKTDDYKFAINKILKMAAIKVVYLLLTENDLIQFFKTAESMKNQTGHLQFVVGDGWGSRVYIAPDKTVANGSITFQVETEEVKEFRDYFLNLKPETNTRNIWFKSFWEQTFNCTFDNDPKGRKVCTGKEQLKEGQGYYSNTPVLSVINAVYAYAYAFRHTIWWQCLRHNRTVENCTQRDKILQGRKSEWVIPFYLERMKFNETFRNRSFSFNTVGDHDENYELLNYHFPNDGSQPVMRKIGTWNNFRNKTTTVTDKRLAVISKPLEPESWRLQIDINRIVWKNQSGVPISVCSNPCDFGYVRSQQTMCCWTCVKCKPNDVTTNNTCRPCNLDHVPDSVRKTCKALQIKYIGMYANVTATILSVSLVGIVLTVAVVVLFVKNINRRIVKASSRELCLNLLFGITLVFTSPIIFILRPSYAVCTVQRLIIGISFTACYAPLLLRTNRIFRIFRSAKTTVTRPMMISPQSQILMSAALTGIGILIGVVSIVGRSSDIQTAYPSHRQFIVRYCKIKGETMILNLSFSSMLMISTTWFAFKTRNFPKNYNEAKYIGLTMYATCLVLAVFLPIFYFVNDAEGRYRTLILCCVCYINAAINLVGLFGTKVWILLMEDKEVMDNNSTKMTTSSCEDMQNHIIATTFDRPLQKLKESETSQL